MMIQKSFHFKFIWLNFLFTARIVGVASIKLAELNMWAIEKHSSYSDYFELFMKRVLGIHHFFSVGMCGLRGRDEESFQM